ncbi:MAG: hypothetical protein K2P14_11225 [Anaeroplasmataceae bacterium]|nr:hypothetical protein [Anaeroplasmataceae bacterium]
MNNNKLYEMSKKYETPLYVFDGNKIRDTYYMMRDALENRVEIFFSVKANPTLAVCQILKNAGSSIEVASKGELHLALAAGFDSQKIIFSGPGKLWSEIEFAIESDIAALIAESFEEVKLINQLAMEKEKVVNIGIRINPSYENVQKNPVVSMMGKGTQFGVDRNELNNIIPYIKKHPQLNLRCFHIYAGSQIFDCHIAIEYFKEAVKLLTNVISEYELKIDIMDFGGGFGVSYDGRKEDFDFKSFSKAALEIIDEYHLSENGRRIAFESGRYLVAKSGFFLTKILYKKCINGTTFLITDAGMNQNALATFREKRIRSNFIMEIISNENEKEIVSVAGPLCTPDDVLGRNIELNSSDSGDILCIPNSGAYGVSFSPMEFLGHPRPCEVICIDEKEYIIRAHGKFEDILENQYGIF